jgi:hypothetical protein
MAEVVSEGGPRGVPGNLELPLGVERLPDGRTLIADGGDEAGFGSEVIEVDEVGRIIWQFDDEGRLRFAHSARRTADGTLLITDTTNNRLLEVARDKRVILDSNNWAGGTGTLSDGSHLHYPNEAYELPDRTILVTDRNNDRCLRVDREGKVLWSFSQEALHHPHNANPLPNGNVLVSDSDGNRVIEVNREKEIVWSYGDGTIEKLWWPRSAARLPSGNTLIADSKNHRLVEVTPRGEVAWLWQTAHVDKFYIAQATAEGTFLVSSTDGHHQVIELDRARSYVWTFRNYRRPFPLYGKLYNGFFKETAEDGSPEGWFLATRISEGGGRLVWDRETRPRPCPGIEFDREGALCLQQAVALEPGGIYRTGAEIRTEGVEGIACLHVDLFDACGGSIFEELGKVPSGEYFKGTCEWTQDAFEFRVPPNVTYGEIRLFLNSPGRAFLRNVMLHRT